jgi:HK97 family phage prohead protease
MSKGKRMLHKAIVAAFELKSGEGETPGPVGVVLSTGSVDRDGDTLAPEGWQVEQFRKNPVVLWAHDSRSLPIGTCNNVRVENGALKGDVTFAAHTMAKDVEQLVRSGVVRSVSVGFDPIEYGPRADEKHPYGLAFKAQELLELSFVPIGSNRDALVERKAFLAEVEKAPAEDAPEESPDAMTRLEAAVARIEAALGRIEALEQAEADKEASEEEPAPEPETPKTFDPARLATAVMEQLRERGI